MSEERPSGQARRDRGQAQACVYQGRVPEPQERHCFHSFNKPQLRPQSRNNATQLHPKPRPPSSWCKRAQSTVQLSKRPSRLNSTSAWLCLQAQNHPSSPRCHSGFSCVSCPQTVLPLPSAHNASSAPRCMSIHEAMYRVGRVHSARWLKTIMAFSVQAWSSVLNA